MVLEVEEGGGEHGGDHRAAEEALQRSEYDHAVDVPGPAAHQAGQGEAGGGDAEQPSCGHDAGEPAGQRDDDDFRNQVAGVDPGDFVGAGGEAAADVAQRCRNDLDVEQGDEEADGHGGEGEHLLAHREVGWGDGGAHWRWSTLAVTERPGRRRPRMEASPSSRMRTGTRWTVLVKVP